MCIHCRFEPRYHRDLWRFCCRIRRITKGLACVFATQIRYALTQSRQGIAYNRDMSLTIDFPKDQEETLRAAFGSSLAQATKEALAIEGYRQEKLSIGEI